MSIDSCSRFGPINFFPCFTPFFIYGNIWGVGNLAIFLLSLFPIIIPSTTQNIERAFLQNDPRMLYSLFPPQRHINISLPEPISFSDQVSNQQAYFLFKKIFSSYTTFEFYSESQPTSLEGKSAIIKTRWSFRDKKNRNQFVFNIFFYLIKLPSQAEGKTGDVWNITEIRAATIWKCSNSLKIKTNSFWPFLWECSFPLSFFAFLKSFLSSHPITTMKEG